MSRFNDWLAAKITNGVATMWAAYAFAALALISLPAAIRSGDVLVIVDWIAQTLLQLVLLSIVMVGQNLNSRGVEEMIKETHSAALSEFEIAKEAQDIAKKELIELKEIAREIHILMKDIEKK